MKRCGNATAAASADGGEVRGSAAPRRLTPWLCVRCLLPWTVPTTYAALCIAKWELAPALAGVLILCWFSPPLLTWGHRLARVCRGEVLHVQEDDTLCEPEPRRLRVAEAAIGTLALLPLLVACAFVFHDRGPLLGVAVLALIALYAASRTRAWREALLAGTVAGGVTRPALADAVAATAPDCLSPATAAHWWTDTGTRNEVQGEPQQQQVGRGGAADR